MSKGIEERMRHAASTDINKTATVYPGDVVELLDARDSTITQQRQTIDALTAALEPFAAGGNLFTASDEFDKSSYVAEPDDAPIGNRLCWNAVPLTIGDLRRAYQALEKARGEQPQQTPTNPETPCAKCGSTTFVYLRSGKRQCVVCRD